MKDAHGFRIPGSSGEEERVARILGVTIILLFGLILVLRAITS